MNFSLLDPFRIGFPNHVDTILYSKSENHPTLVKFSRLGSYLAVGSSHGHVSILITNNPIPLIRLLIPKNERHRYPVSSLSFSYDSQYLAVGHEDGYVAIWDLLESKVFKELTFDNPILQVDIYPWKKKKLLVLVERMDPIVVDLEPEIPTLKELKVNPEVLENLESKRWCDQLFDYTSAAFDSKGKYLALGTNKGLLAIVELPSHNFIHIERNARTTIRQLKFSANSKELMLNCKSFLKILEMSITEREPGQQVKLNFSYPTKYSNHSEGGEWLQCCYDHSGDYVVGCYDLEKTYKIYIWERLGGELHSTLEVSDLGRKVHEIAWHPLHPILASLTSHDELWIWSPKFYQKWSGYSNKFTELTTNLIVMENEDEYDLPYADPSHKIHNLNNNSLIKEPKTLSDVEEPDVDIVTVDNPYGFNNFNDELGDHDEDINLTFEYPLILKLKDQMDFPKLVQLPQIDVDVESPVRSPIYSSPLATTVADLEPFVTQKDLIDAQGIEDAKHAPISEQPLPTGDMNITPYSANPRANSTRSWQRELSVSPAYSDKDTYSQRYPVASRSPFRSPRYGGHRSTYISSGYRSPGYRSPGYDNYPSYRRESPSYHGEVHPHGTIRAFDKRRISRSPSPARVHPSLPYYYNKDRISRYSPPRRLPPPHPRFLERRRYLDEREDPYYRDYSPGPPKSRVLPPPIRGLPYDTHPPYDPYYDSKLHREPVRERGREPLPPLKPRPNEKAEIFPIFENSYRPGKGGARDTESPPPPVSIPLRSVPNEKDRYRARYEDRYERYDRHERMDRYSDRYMDRFNDRYDARYDGRFDSYSREPRNPIPRDLREQRPNQGPNFNKGTLTDSISERKSSGPNLTHKQSPSPPDTLTAPVTTVAEGSEEGEIVE